RMWSVEGSTLMDELPLESDAGAANAGTARVESSNGNAISRHWHMGPEESFSASFMGSESWFAYAFPSPSENSQEIKYPSDRKSAGIFTDARPSRVLTANAPRETKQKPSLKWIRPRKMPHRFFVRLRIGSR